MGELQLWTTKQKRAYHRVLSGLTLGKYLNRKVRFMTLTTAYGVFRDPEDSFRVLKERIRRRYRTFDYVRIKTNEGYGVLHILYFGAFIPMSWLQQQWAEIHQSVIVDIRLIRNKTNNIANYVVTQYLSSQRSNFIRYSWSWAWVFKGFVKKWYDLRTNPIYFYNPIQRIFYLNRKPVNFIEIWNKFLYSYAVSLMQKHLEDWI